MYVPCPPVDDNCCQCDHLRSLTHEVTIRSLAISIVDIWSRTHHEQPTTSRLHAPEPTAPRNQPKWRAANPCKLDLATPESTFRSATCSATSSPAPLGSMHYPYRRWGE